MSLVLVADDEPAVLDALSGVVEDLGHEVIQAHDGKEALELVRRRQPALVITDHMMPHLSGLDLCRTLKGDEALRDIPVILLSGATPHGTPLANAFLPKPFELAEFEQLIARTLDEAPQKPASPPPVPLPREDVAALLSWIAHEMRTPLSASRIQLHLFERAQAKPEADARRKPGKALKRQQNALEQLAGIVAEAGELLRGPLLLAKSPTPIRELVMKHVEAWRERQPDVELTVAPGDELTLDLDATRVGRALDVLIGNAVKHGAKGRSVELAIEPAEHHVAIRVTDHGKGLPANRLPDLFRGFRRDEGAGHGMELYVASEIARAHGGGITVKSAPGEGATFTLSLPRS